LARELNTPIAEIRKMSLKDALMENARIALAHQRQLDALKKRR
jgi:hypothetical protein